MNNQKQSLRPRAPSNLISNKGRSFSCKSGRCRPPFFTHQPTMPTTSTLISGCRSRHRAVDETLRSFRITIGIVALQRRWRRVKDWYRESYPTCDTGEHEPPWILARRANLANCQFYRLPEELILHIVGDLDDVSRAMAMRTCGLLMRILCDHTLFSQTLSYRFPTDFKVWPPFRQRASNMPLEAGPEMLELRKQVDRLLDRDRFCEPCRQFREDGRYEKAMQALQGTLWCSHCNKEHKRPLFSAHQRDAFPVTRICVLVEGKAQVCAHVSMGRDSTRHAASGTEDLCRHPDHDPAWYTRWRGSILNDGDQRPGYARPHLLSLNAPDSRYTTMESKTTFFLVRLSRGVPITRAWLQEQLTAKAHLLDKMLCPHVTARDGQLLLPFGPDRCACFDDPWRIGHSCLRNDSPCWCCRCRSAKVPGLAGYFVPGECNWKHRYECGICYASYRWLRSGAALYLKIGTLTGTSQLAWPVWPRPSSRSYYWVYKLHPESWGILDDEELHHVAWCDDINCMSRWRWERLSRLLLDT